MAELCRELFENRDFSGSDWTNYITTNNEFENKLTEYLTANDMSIYDLIVVAENNSLTETLINIFSYHQTTNNISYSTMNQHISNDTTMDNYMANYPPDMDWRSSNTEISSELTPSNRDDDDFDDEEGNSPNVSFNDPSSDVNPAGQYFSSKAGRD